jgi:hypothetical protein
MGSLFQRMACLTGTNIHVIIGPTVAQLHARLNNNGGSEWQRNHKPGSNQPG